MVSEESNGQAVPVARRRSVFRQVQNALDEGVFTFASGYEAAHLSLPCEPPDSGDFHATVPLEDGSVGVVIGDVHGPEAGTHATVLCQAVVGCLQEGLAPEEALGFVNAAAEMDERFSGFATVFAGKVEPQGILHYASGGHEPALIATPSETAQAENVSPADMRELPSTGPPLGAFGADEVQYRGNTATLPEGATLLLYTDGVLEARRPRDRQAFGFERWQQLFARLCARPSASSPRTNPLRSLLRQLLGRVFTFVGTPQERHDDIALLALRRKKRDSAQEEGRKTVSA